MATAYRRAGSERARASATSARSARRAASVRSISARSGPICLTATAASGANEAQAESAASNGITVRAMTLLIVRRLRRPRSPERPGFTGEYPAQTPGELLGAAGLARAGQVQAIASPWCRPGVPPGSGTRCAASAYFAQATRGFSASRAKFWSLPSYYASLQEPANGRAQRKVSSIANAWDYRALAASEPRCLSAVSSISPGPPPDLLDGDRSSASGANQRASGDTSGSRYATGCSRH